MGVQKKNSKKSSPLPEKRGRGRPATGRVQAERMTVRMAAAEREIIEAAADAAGMTPGAWLLAQGLLNAGQRPK